MVTARVVGPWQRSLIRVSFAAAASTTPCCKLSSTEHAVVNKTWLICKLRCKLDCLYCCEVVNHCQWETTDDQKVPPGTKVRACGTARSSRRATGRASEISLSYLNLIEHQQRPSPPISSSS